MFLSVLEQRLLRGTLKEREQERIRQGITECWETKARRDQEEKKHAHSRNLR